MRWCEVGFQGTTRAATAVRAGSARESPEPAGPLIVEGERCADAARELIGAQFVVVTWPGGAKAVGKADWLPLRGRTVTVWPDADEPGNRAARDVVARLAGIAANVSTVDVGERDKGWDIADAVVEGWRADDLITFLDEHAANAPEARPNSTPRAPAHDTVGIVHGDAVTPEPYSGPIVEGAELLDVGPASCAASLPIHRSMRRSRTRCGSHTRT